MPRIKNILIEIKISLINLIKVLFKGAWLLGTPN